MPLAPVVRGLEAEACECYAVVKREYVLTCKTVACPQCGKLTPFAAENRWRPFCSERCKTIDLGAWASETYRVPDAVPPGQDEDDGS